MVWGWCLVPAALLVCTEIGHIPGHTPGDAAETKGLVQHGSNIHLESFFWLKMNQWTNTQSFPFGKHWGFPEEAVLGTLCSSLWRGRSLLSQHWEHKGQGCSAEWRGGTTAHRHQGACLGCHSRIFCWLECGLCAPKHQPSPYIY